MSPDCDCTRGSIHTGRFYLGHEQCRRCGNSIVKRKPVAFTQPIFLIYADESGPYLTASEIINGAKP